MFPSKQEISRSNRRMGDNLSKWESPVQNRRVGTYVTTTPQHHWSNCSNWGYWSNFPTRQLSHEHIFFTKNLLLQDQINGKQQCYSTGYAYHEFFLEDGIAPLQHVCNNAFSNGFFNAKTTHRVHYPFPMAAYIIIKNDSFIGFF